MKNIIALLAITLIFAGGCSQRGDHFKFKNDTDSVAYVMGMNVARHLLEIDSTINLQAVCKGVADVAAGKEIFSQEEAKVFFLRYLTYTIPEKRRAYEERFLEEFSKANTGYARTASGITYSVSELGDQKMVPVAERDSVVIRYVMRDMNQKELYSSYAKGDTVRMMMKDLNAGLNESLKLIGKGGKIHLWLPAALAYGERGDAELGVLPNATLFYEVELIDVDKFSTRRR